MTIIIITLFTHVANVRVMGVGMDVGVGGCGGGGEAVYGDVDGDMDNVVRLDVRRGATLVRVCPGVKFKAL